jgi:DNA-binding transcriptional ArsR family regulator
VHLVPDDARRGVRDPEGVCDALAAQASVDVRDLAERFAVLADVSRLRILVALLHGGELCVTDLAVTAGLSLSATSHALAQLSQRGLVEVERRGRFAHYRLAESTEAALVRRLVPAPAAAHHHAAAG